jgi:SAM-dependent methyltransferase
VERPTWAPEGVRLDQPSPARIYDYLLGGSHNSAADRHVARQVIEAMPDVADAALANRAFLHRAVRFLVDVGVRQFLDLGSGIPTAGNVHEIAQSTDPDTRVVYVDADPVAVAHSRVLLAGNDRAAVVQADLREPERILDSRQVGRLLDLDAPVGLLMVAILHAIPDADDPARLVARFRDAVAVGSYLAISHGTADSRPKETARVQEISRRTPTRLTMRSHEQISRFFAGFELLDPGLVWVPEWRPDPGDQPNIDPEGSANYGGVGRKNRPGEYVRPEPMT